MQLVASGNIALTITHRGKFNTAPTLPNKYDCTTMPSSINMKEILSLLPTNTGVQKQVRICVHPKAPIQYIAPCVPLAWIADKAKSHALVSPTKGTKPEHPYNIAQIPAVLF